MTRRWLTEDQVDAHIRRTRAVVQQHAAVRAEPSPAAPKPRKYRNQPIVVEGVRFDSRKEAARWQELRALEHAREISELRRQVRFGQLAPTGELLSVYVADFAYRDVMGRLVIEDVKSDATRKLAPYVAKCKWMAAIHGHIIREV